MAGIIGKFAHDHFEIPRRLFGQPRAEMIEDKFVGDRFGASCYMLARK